MTAQEPTRLDARYGRTPSRRRRNRVTALIASAVLVVAAVAWAVWTGVGGSISTFDADTITSTVRSDRATEVRWLVTGRASAALVCAIEARDLQGATVGLVEVAVPVDGSASRGGDTVIRTVRRASAGLIASCRDA